MTEKEGRKFKGFSPKTLKFLRGLKANNNKAWFQAHKADYEKYVLHARLGYRFGGFHAGH